MIDIDKIKQNPNILRVYSQRLKLQRNGREYVAACCFHTDKTPSLKVYEYEGTFLFKCFGCGENGNAIQFIQKLDKISFNESVTKVREIVQDSWQENKKLVESTFKPIEESSKYVTIPISKYAKLEKNLITSNQAQEWLRNRGVNLETAKRLRCGFRQALEYNADKSIAEKGWLAFPCIYGDTVVSIKYRSIVQKAFTRQPGMATALFNTETIDPLDTLYVVEGEIDALTLEQAGFHAVSLPNASTKPTPEMKDMLLSAGTVILAGDNDIAGMEAMDRLWKDLKERTFLLKWSNNGLKDANQVFLEKCHGNIEEFQKLVEELTQQAKSTPMPNIYSLPEAMVSGNRTNLSDHPKRMRFPWSSVDKMAILLPGAVLAISATNTKMGKTQFVMNSTLYGAKKYEEIVLNYQCELDVDEFSNMVTAHVIKKDRNKLSKEDYLKASKLLANVKYYIGRNPTLTTVNPVLDLIEAGIRRLGATTVILDHLHFICRNEDNEIQAQANAMQRIKNMAVQYGVKFIVVGQPRKANQQMKGKLMQVTDFKGSESMTSDADAILVLHREYNKNIDPANPPKDDYNPQTEIHLLGARSKGEGNTFAQLMFKGEYASFWEPAPEEVAISQGTVL